MTIRLRSCTMHTFQNILIKRLQYSNRTAGVKERPKRTSTALPRDSRPVGLADYGL